MKKSNLIIYIFSCLFFCICKNNSDQKETILDLSSIPEGLPVGLNVHVGHIVYNDSKQIPTQAKEQKTGGHCFDFNELTSLVKSYCINYILPILFFYYLYKKYEKKSNITQEPYNSDFFLFLMHTNVIILKKLFQNKMILCLFCRQILHDKESISYESLLQCYRIKKKLKNNSILLEKLDFIIESLQQYFFTIT